MTDKQFEKIKKDLNFYSEGGADNLCTMTETSLRALLDKASKTIVAEHFEAYGQCRDSRRIAELESKLEQVEKDLADYQFNYPKIKDLEKENAELKAKIYGGGYDAVIAKKDADIILLEKQNSELKKQIEKMKCCGNCNGILDDGRRTEKCHRCMDSKELSKWELAND